MSQKLMNTSNKQRSLFEELQGTTDEIISQIRKLIKKGSTRRVMIKNKWGKILFQTTLNAGIAGGSLVAILSPVIAAIGFFGVVLSDMKVVVEKYPAEELQADEYEVETEVIEIDDEENETDDGDDDEVEKTVGK